MKFVTYNIQYGLGKDSRYDLARVAREVQDADVIALQEVERHWQRSGCVDAPAVLASHLPDHHWVFGANLDVDASFRDDAGKLVNRRRQFGTMILSRTPIVSSRNHLLPKYATLAQHSIQQGALEAVIVTPHAGPLRLYSVHLSHLSPQTRAPQVEALLDIHSRATSEGGAWCGGHPDPAAGWTEGGMPPMPVDALLMGDFNFTWSTAEYDRIVGPLSERYGRLNRATGFVDAWVAAGHGEDEGATIAPEDAALASKGAVLASKGATFASKAGTLASKGATLASKAAVLASEGATTTPDRRIDFCFVSSALAGRVRSCWIDAQAVGSDHQPLWIDMDV